MITKFDIRFHIWGQKCGSNCTRNTGYFDSSSIYSVPDSALGNAVQRSICFHSREGVSVPE